MQKRIGGILTYPSLLTYIICKCYPLPLKVLQCNFFSDYESEAGDDDEAEGAKGKGQLAQLDDATLRERIATMGKGETKHLFGSHSIDRGLLYPIHCRIAG